MLKLKKKSTDKTSSSKPSKKGAEVAAKAEHVKYDKLETIDGVYKTIIPDRIKNKPKWERPDPRRILSFIPGTITSIDVEVGQQIKVGEPLLTFKAMKMLNTYLSPFEGKIAVIHTKIDDIVPKGTILIEFE